MNAVGIALLWCVVQVTLLGLMSGGLYLIVRRFRPAAAASVALTGLLTVVLLSALALAPWPRWQLARVGPQPHDGLPARADASLSSGEETRDDFPEPIAGQELASHRLLQAAWWWQSFLGELSRSQPIAAETRWRWPAIVAAVVLTGMGVGAGWLLLGLLAVRRQRTRSRPVEDPALLDLVAVLRAELGCRRPVEVCLSNDLATAATIGWRRPVILLPPAWTAWTAEQRRAVLAHEIAHVCRNDFLAVLCGQLGLVLHFYHPLLHWLMARLRLEQELAADADAATVAGGRREYLMTIADLALKQEARPMLWPARSFLPTQTTFLRRIAMLRDAKLRFDRLSPMARTLAVGIVLVFGLLVAGLRAPGYLPLALAEDAKPAAPAALEGPDKIDTTFFTKSAATIIVMRPATVFARPELAGLAQLFQQSTYVVPEGTRLADFRQITILLPGTEEPPRGPPVASSLWEPAGLREVVAFRSTKPLAAVSLGPRGNAGVMVKEYEGKKVYAGLLNGLVVVQYDDHTLITFGGESLMHRYFATKRGVLPKWLPAKAWEEFGGDHFVVVADGAPMRKEMAMVTAHGPRIVRAATSAFFSLWEDTAWVAIGAKLDDKVAINAWLEGRDAEAAARLDHTVEALKLLGQNMLRAAHQALESHRWPESEWTLPLVEIGERLLASTKIQQDAKSVRVLGTAESNAATLKAIGGGSIAARHAADRSQSVTNLKRIALAMHNYHATYRQFPPAVLYGPDGKTPYSWRVALLPFLDQMALYKHYRFDEPWDGPNNRRLAETRVPVYHAPSEAAQSANASYFALVGPGTVFEENKLMGLLTDGSGRLHISTKGASFRDIIDGTSNTLMIVEAKRDIAWSKPDDIPYDPKKPIPELGGYFEGGFHAALCDGSVHFLATNIAEATLRAMISRNGREEIDWRKEIQKR